MENQHILIGIGVLILFIAIVFAVVTVSIVSIQKPPEKPKPAPILPVKEPIAERLYREIERIRRHSSDFYERDYLIIMNRESYSELDRFLRLQFWYNPYGKQKFQELPIMVHGRLEQDILIVNLSENQ